MSIAKISIFILNPSLAPKHVGEQKRVATIMGGPRTPYGVSTLQTRAAVTEGGGERERERERATKKEKAK